MSSFTKLKTRPYWLKGRGYLHITPKINVLRKHKEILNKVKNENFIKAHGFFPLIHAVIKERKFKKIPHSEKKRGHSYEAESGVVKTAKLRPLHYATHIDSLIFGYYAELLLELYERELQLNEGLAKCITAYRKIEIDPITEGERGGKSTIEFAEEAFKEIKNRNKEGCVALMFDVKSFFSELDHNKLKKAWCDLLHVDRLNDAHFNVFKAATNFSYILLDDLRLISNKGNRRKGFDEKKLAFIRKNKGIEAFFESLEEFRSILKNKQLTVYKHPFIKNKLPVGIPQGLPISAVLANLYMLDFDKEVLETVVMKHSGFYRRYSDDILIICKPDEALFIEDFITKCILKSHLEISSSKTEKYLFKNYQISYRKNKLTSILLTKDRCYIGKPLTYLGFEFYGSKILIKSANLAKFYRRMIYSVKQKAKRANKIGRYLDTVNPAIYRRRLKKTYADLKTNSNCRPVKRKILKKNNEGTYSMIIRKSKLKHTTNYFSYVRRASVIMNEPSIERQLKSYKRIFNSSIHRHLKTKPRIHN